MLSGRLLVSAEIVPDVEWALREWLRAELPAIKVWLDVPKGTPTFPLIVIGGRIGGAPDRYVPIDQPRVSFSVWGGPGGNGRKLARDVMSLLVDTIVTAESVLLDLNTFSYGAAVESIMWLPDDSDPDNVLARYVVDVTFGVRSS
jgi:hypothetical protein